MPRLLIALQIGVLVTLTAFGARASVVDIATWGELTNAPADQTNFVAIAIGNGFGLAIRNDGTLENWGGPPYGIGVPTGVSNVAQIAVSDSHSLALKSDGTVAAWGYDGYGQCDVPIGLSNVVAVAAGGYHSLALRTDGTVAAWGLSTFGETSIPAGLTNVVAISGGGYYSVALRADGTVIAWGDNSYCELCVPSGLSNIVAVSAGWYHCLALRNDGQVFAWGYNFWGQSQIPAGLSNVVAVAAGYNHSLALTRNGSVVGWGDNSKGEVQTPALPSNVVAIAVASYSSAAVIASAPFILQQPVGQSTYSGWNVILQTSVVGPSPTTYAWQHDGLNLSQATNAVLTLTNVQLPDAGMYSVEVVQQFTTNRSLAVPLAIYNSAPIILAQGPLYQMLQTGSSTTYSVGVTGSLPTFFQWHANGANLPGATTSTLALTNLQWGNNATYQLIASNAYGVATSPNFVLDLMDLPTALNATSLVWTTSGSASWFWETNTTYNNIAAAQSGPIQTGWDVAGQQTTLGTSLNGPATLTFWWQVSCDPTWASLSFLVNGVTQTSITGAANWQQQTVYLGNGAQNLDWPFTWAGYITETTPQVGWLAQVGVSNGATLPFITVPPTNLTVAAGNNATFNVQGAGTPPLVYSWELNGVIIPAATNRTLTLTNAQAGNAGVVTAIVTNAYGGASSSANVVVTPSPPSIVAQPQPAGRQALTGSTVNYSAMVHGSQPLSYQWILNGAPISGATTTSLVLSNLSVAQSGTYVLTVGNAYGTTNSTPVILMVVPRMVVGWGNNVYGQTNTPLDLTNAVALSSANIGIMALQSSGLARAWGSQSQPTIPVAATNLVAVAQGYDHNLALRNNGTVIAWGVDSSGQTNVPSGLGNVVGISAGSEYSLALKSDGTVVAWGYPGYGLTNIPATFTNIAGISAGAYHSLALTSNGLVLAWGSNSSGQTNVPPSLSNVVAIAAGGAHSLALRNDGSITAWGNNSYGQANVPVAASNCIAIAAGGYHSVAVRNDGRVIAWGLNNYGQTNVPPFATNAIAIAAGASHTLALLRSPFRTGPFFATSPLAYTTSGFEIQIDGLSGHGPVILYGSTNLTDWRPILTNPPVFDNVLLTDPSATNVPIQFYRAVEQ